MINIPLIKKPSAWLPLVMSLAGLALILGYLSIHGVANQTDEVHDEGAAARVFQMLMAGQLPVMAYFALKWLPKSPKQALLVLALQVSAWIPPFAILLWLE